MPNRLLREGICTSDPINALPEQAEILFYRLLVVADDYGYMDARPAIIKAQCFPLRDSMTTAAIEKALCHLAAAGLICRYLNDGKPYLAVNKWEQRVRSRPKYVGPHASGCQPIDGQMTVKVQADDGLGKGKGKGKGADAKTPMPDDFAISERVQAWATEKGIHNLAEHFEYFTNAAKAKGYAYADWDRALMNAVLKDWAKIGKGRPPSPDVGLRVAV